jgi:hypothetical protein
MNQKIQLRCKCLRGKKGVFVKGKLYAVHRLFQAPDGDFMVEVTDHVGLIISARANRFLLP